MANLGPESTCSIARALDTVGDAWMLLIVRDAMIKGSTRFHEFREGLGIAPNILTKRLTTLVDAGIMERRAYREAGSRSRDEYVLTESGRSLSLVVGALATWGRTYLPHAAGTSPLFATGDGDAAAQLAFVAADGEQLPPDKVVAHRTADTALPS